MKNGTPSIEAEFEQWLVLALEYERKRMLQQSAPPKENSPSNSPQAANHQGQSTDPRHRSSSSAASATLRGDAGANQAIP